MDQVNDLKQARALLTPLAESCKIQVIKKANARVLVADGLDDKYETDNDH